jgi:hypothetical protein
VSTPRTVTVNVTKTDIRKGAPQSAANCPVSRAIRRATDEVAYVAPDHVVFMGRPGEFQLPENVERAIITYDEGMGMEPMSFELVLP